MVKANHKGNYTKSFKSTRICFYASAHENDTYAMTTYGRKCLISITDICYYRHYLCNIKLQAFLLEISYLILAK